MADWLSLKEVSKKTGIPESTLRTWKSLSYITTSTIDNVVMIDYDHLSRFLKQNQVKGLDDEYLKELIKEKELEREVILSHYDDELFLLKTYGLYQPLFDVIIKELGALMTDDKQRELFLAISSGELILRVAERHQMTYAQAIEEYKSILKNLGENTERIAAYRKQTLKRFFAKFNETDPTRVKVQQLFNSRACGILKNEAEIETVRELLEYTSKHGWEKLNDLKGMGEITYQHIIERLCLTHFITNVDEKIRLSPEIATLMI